MNKSPDAFRTISEVAEWLGVQAHVLRFWESKFAQVKPVKRAGGRRYYRPADMLLIGGIKKLLHDDGLTIKGVQKILREQGISEVADQSQPLDELTMAELDSSAAPGKAMRDLAAQQVPAPEAPPALPDDTPVPQVDDTPSGSASENVEPLEAVQATQDEVAATVPPEAPADTTPAEDVGAAFKDMPMMSDNALPAAPETDNLADATPDIDEPAEPEPQGVMAESGPPAEDKTEPEMSPIAAADPDDGPEFIAPSAPTVEDVADQAPPLELKEPNSVDPTPEGDNPAPMTEAVDHAEPETPSFDFDPPADETPSLTADVAPDIDDPAPMPEPEMAATLETVPSAPEPEHPAPEAGHAADPETPEDANALPAFLRRPLDASTEETPEDTAPTPTFEEDATPRDPLPIDAVPDAPVAPKPRMIDLPALPEEAEMPAAPAALTSLTRVRALSPDQAAALRPMLAELTQLRDQMAGQARTVSKD